MHPGRVPGASPVYRGIRCPARLLAGELQEEVGTVCGDEVDPVFDGPYHVGGLFTVQTFEAIFNALMSLSHVGLFRYTP